MEAPGFRKAIAADAPTLVLFTASWCPFCVRFDPVWQELAPGFGGPTLVAPLEEDADPRWDEFRIEVVPTVAVFRNGVPVARLDGVLRRGILRGDLERFLKALPPPARSHTGAF